MQAKALFPAIISSFLSFALNLLFDHNLSVSLLNCLTLGLSVYLFQNYLASKKSLFNIFLTVSLGLIPLFYYLPANKLIAYLPLFSLGLFYLYRKLPKKYGIIIFWGLFLFFGNFYSGEIIKYPFNIQHSQLIFNSPEVNYNMHRHQQDALFIPYKARLLVYSQLVYVYALLTNLFNFLNLKNLSDILLIANLYPLFVGIHNIFKHKNIFRSFILTAFLVTALTAGIDRSTDKFQSLYLLGPIFIYLILYGAQTINKKLYFTLWILSLFISISPKI